MNNPFNYKPDSLCVKVAEELMRYIDNKDEWREEMRSGKMFGVLIVEPGGSDNSRLSPLDPRLSTLDYLVAYSGQILGRSDWDGFVPPVFDYLQPDGYFKREEQEIVRINAQIKELKKSAERSRLVERYTACMKRQKEALNRQQTINDASKMLRDQQRKEGHLSEHEKNALIRESQYQKAQRHRMKLQFAEELEQVEKPIKAFDEKIADLENEGKERSRALQQWLFSHFKMLNSRGEERSLLDIFSNTPFKIPPSGAGECCEPKLLQYAFAHGLRPVSMAMFWYGGHPEKELRIHGHFYPACSGKCKPILYWMLDGIVDFLAYKQESAATRVCEDAEMMEPEVLFEDNAVLVVNKPAGLLTVPGIETRHSVFSIFRQRYPHTDSPLIVHRLDQATSGLLVLAKTRAAYIALQRQFTERTVMKRYVAVLSRIPIQNEGVISLPLRPDPMDRPRQLVDREHGKAAVTEYKITKTEGDRAWVRLHPLTGRTHQLRVHCAHPYGLNAPIVGDELYCDCAERMYLHAEYLEFSHPVTGERLTFTAPNDFNAHKDLMVLND